MLTKHELPLGIREDMEQMVMPEYFILLKSILQMHHTSDRVKVISRTLLFCGGLLRGVRSAYS